MTTGHEKLGMEAEAVRDDFVPTADYVSPKLLDFEYRRTPNHRRVFRQYLSDEGQSAP